MNKIPEPYHGGGYDILNAVQDLGGIKTKPKGYKGGEYDAKPHLFGIYLGIMGGHSAPDQMAALLTEQNFGDGTVETMWALVSRALDSRVRFLETLKHDREARQAERRAFALGLMEEAPF